MTTSYLAGVARRTAPGRAALLPPVTPWGVEARPVAPQPEPPRAAATEEPLPAPLGTKRPGTSKSPTARLAVAEGAVSEAIAARPDRSGRAPNPPAPDSVRRAEAESSEEIENSSLEPPRLDGSEPPHSAEPAPPAETPRRRTAPEKQPVQTRRREQVSARAPTEPADEPVAPASRRPASRAARSQRTAPPVRIETIEVVVERPQSPAPPAERPAAAPAAAASPAALARGYSSLIGLRQG